MTEEILDTPAAPEHEVAEPFSSKCLYNECARMIPIVGWCSRRHADMWRSKNGLTRTHQIPENIRIEINKRGSYWNKKYAAAMNEVRRENELRAAKEAAQKMGDPSAAKLVTVDPAPQTEVTGPSTSQS